LPRSPTASPNTSHWRACKAASISFCSDFANPLSYLQDIRVCMSLPSSARRVSIRADWPNSLVRAASRSAEDKLKLMSISIEDEVGPSEVDPDIRDSARATYAGFRLCKLAQSDQKRLPFSKYRSKSLLDPRTLSRRTNPVESPASSQRLPPPIPRHQKSSEQQLQSAD